MSDRLQRYHWPTTTRSPHRLSPLCTVQRLERRMLPKQTITSTVGVVFVHSKPNGQFHELQKNVLCVVTHLIFTDSRCKADDRRTSLFFFSRQHHLFCEEQSPISPLPSVHVDILPPQYQLVPFVCLRLTTSLDPVYQMVFRATQF